MRLFFYILQLKKIILMRIIKTKTTKTSISNGIHENVSNFLNLFIELKSSKIVKGIVVVVVDRLK